MTDFQHEVLIGALLGNMNTQTHAHGHKDGLAAVRTIRNHEIMLKSIKKP